MTAGYSKRSLVQKLGLKPGFKFILLNAPPDYNHALDPLPENVSISESLDDKPFDFIHFFTKSKSELENRFNELKQALAFDGMLWISWPKKASKVETDVSSSVVREIGLAHGLVDVKVAAVDEVWSGLKFVYRIEDRPKR